MNELAKERIRALLQKKGTTMKAASLGAGLGETFVRDVLERGRDPSVGNLAKLAGYLNVPLSHLIDNPTSPQLIPVVGSVGAGAEVRPIDDHAKGASFEAVEIDFPVRAGTVAVVVRGDSMLPIFEDGDLIGYMRDAVHPSELLGKLCIVKLLDGRMFLKRLKRGSAPGLFTLVSINARDVEDVQVEWAARYRFHLPADEWRRLMKVTG